MIKRFLFVSLAFLGGGIMAFGQTESKIVPDYSKYPDANPYPKVVNTKSTLQKSATTGVARSTAYGGQRPDHVNNALTKFYPPVFNQSGGSCGSAQAVGYMMTYDMNSYRNHDASTPDHQLPTHFTWLHTYSGIDKYEIMNKHGVPTVTTYGGRTYSELFGNQDTSSPDYGYMQGYDKWYSAMFNRTVGGDIFCDQKQDTEAGREQLKQWLWNRWGDYSFQAGGISGIGVASGGRWGRVPNTATNNAIGVAGMYCVTTWGKTYDHALTIVGYDDRIEFDLDSNGVYGETSKEEVGAWIICNSWGPGWCNKGFVYCPYKYSYAIGTNVLALNSGHYTWRKDYVPKRVLKITMDYSRRSELRLSAGVAQDTSATTPEKSEAMPFFSFAGDGTKSTPAPEVPMLGRWRTGMNYEPMEFGYDMTDLSAAYDLSKPIKYFLYINTSSGALGEGNVYKLSLMDYSLDPEGMEIPARVDTVSILNGGKVTVISVTALGQQMYAPLNVALNNNHLTWSAPKSSSYEVARYYIYKGGQKVAEVPGISCAYTVDDAEATYYVATAYKYRDGVVVSGKSNPARNNNVVASSETNKVLNLSNKSVLIPELLSSALDQASIEFWIKPASIASYNQQIGLGWGSFLFCTTNTGQIQCGWDATNRAVTPASALKKGVWSHVAIVVDYNKITIYVNGMRKASYTSSVYSGIPALSNFYLGTDAGTFDAQLDELRVWAKALTQIDVFRNKNMAVANPKGHSDLLAYYPMDTYSSNGQLYLKDCASSYDAALDNVEVEEDNSLLTGANVATASTFNLPDAPMYVGEPLRFNSTAMVNTVSWQWSAPGATQPALSMSNPCFIYTEPGTYSITQTITDNSGKVVDSTRTITVENPAAPVADFDIPNTMLEEGEFFSLANKSSGENATFKWLTPGADEEEMHSVNATVTYNKEGTYPVTLIAENFGGRSEKTIQVNVVRAAPRVQFSVNPTTLMMGEATYLVDNTRNNASEWKWTVSNGKHSYIVNGQNSSLTPTHPGYYDVTLEVTNDVGTSTKTEKGVLLVLNANSQNALSFGGGEKLVSTADVFADGTRNFTIEWWMNPGKIAGALNMSTSNEQFSISTGDNGVMTISVGGKSVDSDEGYVKDDGWHHYAITCSSGMVKFYRDGQTISMPTTRLAISTNNWGKLTISDAANPYKGQIDELRIWNKSLGLTVMKNYINGPLENVDDLVNNSGLEAYYDFNQNGGSVKDRTANNNDLTRVGFGPDGDAWGLSVGVFSLDLDAASAAEEIDADGLTSVYSAVRAGKVSKVSGLKGAIRIACEQKEQIRIFTTDGKCVFNNDVEGVHVLRFEPGIYVVDGEKIRVE